jgi:hypothetical protein
MLSFVYADSSHSFTVQENDTGDWYSDSDGDSYADNGSESGDEEYGVPWLAKS